ncbi:MAG TPA: hypothetical protein VFI27_06300 [candidate division Zixibacteria bacterium]|nr:hypothetical protein [candidate division Zixibacteria bacterium]
MSRIKWITAVGMLIGIFAMFFVLTNLAEANVDLLYFRAQSGTDSITLEWETASELDNLGFNILRSETDNIGDAEIINPLLIQSLVGGQPIGAYYEWIDDSVEANIDYLYWLQDIDFNGNIIAHGPVEASVTGGNAIPTVPVINTTQPTETATRTPESTPSPTSVSTSPAEPTSTATPRTTELPTQTLTLVQSTPVTGPAQPTQSIQENQQATAAAEMDTLTSPNPQSTETSPVVLHSDGVTPEDGQAQLAEAVGDSTTEQVVQENQQDPPPAIAQEQLSSDVNSQNVGRGNSRATELESTETDAKSSSTNTTTLALIILAAAILLAVGGGIAIWLILKPQGSNQVDE